MSGVLRARHERSGATDMKFIPFRSLAFHSCLFSTSDGRVRVAGNLILTELRIFEEKTTGVYLSEAGCLIFRAPDGHIDYADAAAPGTLAMRAHTTRYSFCYGLVARSRLQLMSFFFVVTLVCFCGQSGCEVSAAPHANSVPAPIVAHIFAMWRCVFRHIAAELFPVLRIRAASRALRTVEQLFSYAAPSQQSDLSARIQGLKASIHPAVPLWTTGGSAISPNLAVYLAATVPHLKALCKSRGLPVSCKKKRELVQRLCEQDSGGPAPEEGTCAVGMSPVSGVENRCCFSLFYTEGSDDLVQCQAGFYFRLLVEHAVRCVDHENTGFVQYRHVRSALSALSITLSDDEMLEVVTESRVLYDGRVTPALLSSYAARPVSSHVPARAALRVTRVRHLSRTDLGWHRPSRVPQSTFWSCPTGRSWCASVGPCASVEQCNRCRPTGCSNRMYVQLSVCPYVLAERLSIHNGSLLHSM